MKAFKAREEAGRWEERTRCGYGCNSRTWCGRHLKRKRGCERQMKTRKEGTEQEVPASREDLPATRVEHSRQMMMALLRRVSL